MTSSATRRKMRREVERRARSARFDAADELPVSTEMAEHFSDDLYGYDLRPLRAHGRYRVRWTVDHDPQHALSSLAALRTKVLEPLERALVADCRADGLSWDDIGWALRVSGEAARKRHAATVQELGL